ncbi:MAG: hypothetical protein WA029_20360 [Anaerolineae bacterium]
MPPNSIFSAGQVMAASVHGLREAQRELTRLSRSVSADDAPMRGQMQLALLQMQRYALGITHVRTGRLKNSIFTAIEHEGNTLRGYVATNVNYAWYEERRGHEHAFFERTVREEGPAVNSLLDRPVRVLLGGR